MKRLVRRRDVAIKHHAEPIEAYEIEPFLDNAKAVEDSMLRYSKSARKSRDDDRHLVAQVKALIAHFPR